MCRWGGGAWRGLGRLTSLSTCIHACQNIQTADSIEQPAHVVDPGSMFCIFAPAMFSIERCAPLAATLCILPFIHSHALPHHIPPHDHFSDSQLHTLLQHHLQKLSCRALAFPSFGRRSSHHLHWRLQSSGYSV